MWTAVALFYKELPPWVKRFIYILITVVFLLAIYWFVLGRVNKILTEQYNKGYQSGVIAEKARVAEENAKAMEAINQQNKQILKDATDSIKRLEAVNKESQDTTFKILTNLSKHPAAVVKNGKCVPTKEYNESWNAIINEHQLKAGGK